MPEPDEAAPELPQRCPACGRPAGAADRFCEADGTPLRAEPAEGPRTTCACGVGAGQDGGDGFCTRCGMRLEPAAPPEEGDGTALAPAPDLGAATHVGRSHHVDEDAVAVARRTTPDGPWHAIVVCDGVSASSHGEQASDHAARAALAVLTAAGDAPQPFDPESAFGDAVAAAHRAIHGAGIEAVEGKDPPGTTLVAAVAHAGRVDVGWVGDSRAYLIGPPLQDGSALTAVALTRDHSWVNMVVDAGQMTEDEAMHSPYAHALVRCVGPLETADPDRPPEVSVGHADAPPGSRLVVCSDGLWNYAPSPDDIAALLARTPAGSDARTIAWDLVHHALAMGGHDDITVAVALL